MAPSGSIELAKNQQTFDIFISYRQLDAKDTAMFLYAMLTQRYKLRVFLDAQELDNLHDLAQLVRKSKCIVAIISPGYLETLLNPQSWCSLEIITALGAGIPLVPVYDPEKTGIPGLDYTNRLSPDIKPLFKILFKAIRREGEYLDVFFKDMLRSAGHENAWVMASGNPWEALDCTPRTKYMFQASALRFEVARMLIKQLGLSDIDDFKFVTDEMIKPIGMKPLEAAKVSELVRRIKQGEWSHVTDADVLAGVYDVPSDTASMAGGSDAGSVANSLRVRYAALTVSAAAKITTQRQLQNSPSMQSNRSTGSTNSRAPSLPPGGNTSPGGTSNPPTRMPQPLSKTGTMARVSSFADSVGTDGTIAAAMSITRVTSGDLAELAAMLAKARRPMTFDLANRTFSSASWRGVLLCGCDGITMSGGTIALRPGQKMIVSGQDVLLEDLVIKTSRSGGATSVHSHGVDDDGSTDEDEEEEEESDDEESDEESDEDDDEEEEEEEEEDGEGEEGEEVAGEDGEGTPAEDEEDDEPRMVGKARDALVEIRDGAVATLRRVTLVAHGKRDAALRVVQGGTVTAMDCVASNTGGDSDQHVVVVSGAGCVVHAEESRFTNCFGSIIVVNQAGTCKLFGCVVSKSKRRGGIEVTDFGSLVIADTTQVVKNRNAGLAVHNGATAQLDSCAFEGSVTSSGVVVVGKGTKITAHNTQFKDNQQAGAYICDNAVLSATGCLFSSNRQHSVEVEGNQSCIAYDLRTKFMPQKPSASKGALMNFIT